MVHALRETWHAWFLLARLLVPITIVTKLLSDAGAVRYLAVPLEPLMAAVGLPASMGLVLATGMLTNLYAAMVVFSELAPGESLTVAQVSVLAVMMLAAHSLPVELRIAQKAGARLRSILLIRLAGAAAFGAVVHLCAEWSGWGQTANRALWHPEPVAPGWLPWAQSQAHTLVGIFGIVLVLIVGMDVLKRLGITDFLTRMLEPLLRAMGMGRNAAPLTMIGVLLGISYGGALLIREAQSGNVPRRDVFFSMAFMGLSHSIIEDSLLMGLIGGHPYATVGARLIFTFVAMAVLVRVVSRMGEGFVRRWCVRGEPA